jgi:sterol desaturase/sphingolipid hydroxylase (fatty acid hydroxylase superfamily)
MDSFGLKAIFITCLVFVPLERLFALHPDQKIFRHAWGNDLIFLFVNGVLTKLAILAIVVASMFAAPRIIPASFQSAVGGLPYWVQIPVAILLSDLVVYWMHRMFHAVPWLWKFHAIHHSAEELDWLVAFRVHPVDQILTKGLSLVPVFTIGFSDWTIGLYTLLFYWQSIFIHANVRIGFGPLRWLIASPEFHHWHHSNDIDARDKNFAAQLPVLDALFGSLHLPRGQVPTAYGLDQPMPQRYVPQLIYPFVGDRIIQSTSDAGVIGETMRAPEVGPSTRPQVGGWRLGLIHRLIQSLKQFANNLSWVRKADHRFLSTSSDHCRIIVVDGENASLKQ